MRLSGLLVCGACGATLLEALQLNLGVRWLPAAVLLSVFSSPSCIPVRGEDTFEPSTGLQFFSMFTELSEALEVDEEMNTRAGMRGNAIELWMLKSVCGFLGAVGANELCLELLG